MTRLLLLDSRARFAGSFDEGILSCPWVYVMVVGTGADENWVIEFHCGVHHVRKDRSTQSSDILSVRIPGVSPLARADFNMAG